jgi:hypothetical protein
MKNEKDDWSRVSRRVEVANGQKARWGGGKGKPGRMEGRREGRKGGRKPRLAAALGAMMSFLVGAVCGCEQIVRLLETKQKQGGGGKGKTWSSTGGGAGSDDELPCVRNAAKKFFIVQVSGNKVSVL